MDRKLTFIAILLAVCMIAGWAIVWYLAATILSGAGARAESLKNTAQQSNRAAFSERLRALGTETKSEREQLELFAKADVISIVRAIEDTGKTVGVAVEVSDAKPEGEGSELPGGARLVPVSFVVQARGGFQSLVHAAELLGSLALPSAISQLEYEKEKDGTWLMTARIRVLTTAPVSL